MDARNAPRGSSRIPVVLDTDIGTDVDDAWALVLLQALPTFDLVGVTTVHANARLRASIALGLLASSGRSDVPVAAGADQPLAGGPQAMLQGHEEEGCVALTNPGRTVSGASAVDFILQASRRYAGDLAIIAIGPLTNIALAMTKDPSLSARLRGITLMGGGWHLNYHNRREYNFKCDPQAANVLLRSGVPIRMVGYNVTDGCRFTRDELRALTSSERPLARDLRALTEIYFRVLEPLRKPKWRAKPYTLLHDPLTVAAAATSDALVRFERVAVLVGANGRCPIVDDPKRKRPEIVLDADGDAVSEDQVTGGAPCVEVEMARSVSVRAFKLFIKPYLAGALGGVTP